MSDITREESIRRLVMLHDLMIHLKEKAPDIVAFDMSHWATTYTADEDRDVIVLREGECGTACCMLGSAALQPEFRELGLGLEVQQTGSFVFNAPVFDRLVGMDAGAAFFGISHDESRYLFDPDSYEAETYDADRDTYRAVTVEEAAAHVAWVLRERDVDTQGKPIGDE